MGGVRQGCPLSPLLYVLYVEPLAEAIRRSRCIKGVAIPGGGGEELRVAQYADDMTLFLSTERDLREALGVVRDFSRGSGALLNVDKSQMKYFGVWKARAEALCGLSLTEGPIRILGVDFQGDAAEDAKNNWERRLAGVRRKLGLWSLRHLTISGKVLVLKADVLPSLLYLARVYVMPLGLRRDLTRTVFRFLWEGWEYVRRVTMYQTDRLLQRRHHLLRPRACQPGPKRGLAPGDDERSHAYLGFSAYDGAGRFSSSKQKASCLPAGAGMRNTLRFTWRGEGENVMSRVEFVKVVLLDLLKADPGGVFCLQKNGAVQAFDLSLGSSASFESVKKLCEERSEQEPLSSFVVTSLERRNFKIVTTHVYNPCVGDEVIGNFLSRYGQELPGVRYLKDSYGIWTAKRQFRILLKEDLRGHDGLRTWSRRGGTWRLWRRGRP
ncbi:hypothetical protein SKAU_G00155030 [Synaphobranchus kaupii]|uniref:Reverse transcriptase domain-containing protein n=1 Tax=Synaphobranchus kaupii TaxID=118154 RepID=A0A9Q1FHJ9_SYNKA|nr:hypothetical protein SKAU_G00155030 [Synaphobranchus kaupii]